MRFIFCCVLAIILNVHFSVCKIFGRICQESGFEFCCTDFYEHDNGTCIECDIGLTTTNGTKPCVKCTNLKYGRRCVYDCTCAPDRCHHVFGCVNYTTRIIKAPQIPENNDTHIPENNDEITMLTGNISIQSNNASLSPKILDNDTSLLYTTVHNIKKTSVMIILYSVGGFLVVLTLLLLIAAGIRVKLRYVKNAQDKPVSIQDEHLYEFIAEDSVASQISNKNIEENRPYLPPPDLSFLSVPLDLYEEKEYDYIYNDDGYLNPYDGLKIPEFQDHLYNQLHKQSEKN